MASLFRRISKSQFRNFSSAKLSSSTTLNFLSARVDSNPLGPLFQVRSVVTAMETVSGFDEMVSGSRRKYYMLGGKGGVGKTSSAASLAVKFANHGHPTIVVSTDPAHSLSDSFDQDLSGGMLVPIQGVNSSLYALEISPEKTKEQVQSLNQGELGVKNIMDNMGLGALAGQLGDFKIEELFDTIPGIDEVLAISKVMDILESEEYTGFSRIVFDTAPTGHTIRMLTLPKTMDASLGKMMKFKKKIASATAALKSAFGKGEPQLDGDRLDEIRETMKKVQDLFHDSERTEFVIITIPTVMALRESSRLCASLRKEKVPVNRLIVNQLLPSSTECKFCSMKRKDQMRALDMIQKDPQLANLKLVHSPLMDVEIRGVPALKFMGDIIWK